MSDEIEPQKPSDESVIAAKIDELCERFVDSLREGQAIELHTLVSEVPEDSTNDLIRRLAFAEAAFCATSDREMDLGAYINQFEVDERFVQDVFRYAHQVQQASSSSDQEISDGVTGDNEPNNKAKTYPSRTSDSTVSEPTKLLDESSLTLNEALRASLEDSNAEGGRFRPGSRFGRYILSRKIDEGGMGEVWQAFDSHLDTIVALKFPLFDDKENASAIAQFRKEAQTLAKLFHPNICRIFDVDCLEDQWYIAMAYVQGKSLDYEKDRSLRDVLDIVRTVALALHEAHVKGIIHRDVKPSNVILDDDGKPVVLDFGLAVYEREVRTNQMGFNGGTLRFMAPEQILNQRQSVSIQSDVYGLGALLYMVLTNRAIYEVDSVKSLVAAHADPNTSPEPPSTHRKDIPPQLDAICLKALSNDVDDRFQSMLEVSEALQQLLEGEIASAEPIRRELIRFEFMGQNRVAPENNRWQDRLFLDTGNRLAEGVIDHHQLDFLEACATRLVHERLEFVESAIKPWRKSTETFTLITHAQPDLDCVCSSYVAIRRLTGQSQPECARQLIHYVQSIDQGYPGISSRFPFGLYAAFMQRSHSLADRIWADPSDCWRQTMTDGIAIVDHVVRQLDAQIATHGQATSEVYAIDAFLAPGIFRPRDRQEILEDAACYERKLRSSDSQPFMQLLDVLDYEGENRRVPFLFIRDVQDAESEERCMFFKDWARSDREACPATNGFVGLCVHSRAKNAQHCIISVRPADQVHLEGLGARLDQVEMQLRSQLFGFDDRQFDRETKEALPKRPGYANSDPWYDGRGHRHTIIGSPIAGTVMTEDQIERVILEYYSKNVADAEDTRLSD